MTLRPPFYPHRKNPNGSYDSICLQCLMTIGTSEDEKLLVRLEDAHICEFKALSKRGKG
jgi:hypothetical protein